MFARCGLGDFTGELLLGIPGTGCFVRSPADDGACIGIDPYLNFPVFIQRRILIGKKSLESIRKVLGATVAQLWMMLSKDFLFLVLISCVIASPLAFYFLNDWLQNYTYRIQMGADVFVLAIGIAIVLTLLTVSFQAIKAALMNPVKSLRNE